jgi:prophage maintenance system killer protein
VQYFRAYTSYAQRIISPFIPEDEASTIEDTATINTHANIMSQKLHRNSRTETARFSTAHRLSISEEHVELDGRVSHTAMHYFLVEGHRRSITFRLAYLHEDDTTPLRRRPYT